MSPPRIYADFHNADSQGRLHLNCDGTVEDLSQQRIELQSGLRLNLYSDDLGENGDLDVLLVEGIVSFAEEERCWVAAIDWTSIRHASNSQAVPASEQR